MIRKFTVSYKGFPTSAGRMARPHDRPPWTYLEDGEVGLEALRYRLVVVRHREPRRELVHVRHVDVYRDESGQPRGALSAGGAVDGPHDKTVGATGFIVQGGEDEESPGLVVVEDAVAVPGRDAVLQVRVGALVRVRGVDGEEDLFLRVVLLQRDEEVLAVEDGRVVVLVQHVDDDGHACVAGWGAPVHRHGRQVVAARSLAVQRSVQQDLARVRLDVEGGGGGAAQDVLHVVVAVAVVAVDGAHLQDLRTFLQGLLDSGTGHQNERVGKLRYRSVCIKGSFLLLMMRHLSVCSKGKKFCRKIEVCTLRDFFFC